MIELRNRVLKSGQVILEHRENKIIKQQGFDNKGQHIHMITAWEPVPYVDEDGNPLEINTENGRISHG